MLLNGEPTIHRRAASQVCMAAKHLQARLLYQGERDLTLELSRVHTMVLGVISAGPVDILQMQVQTRSPENCSAEMRVTPSHLELLWELHACSAAHSIRAPAQLCLLYMTSLPGTRRTAGKIQAQQTEEAASQTLYNA